MWNEEFRFLVTDPDLALLRFTIFDTDKVLSYLKNGFITRNNGVPMTLAPFKKSIGLQKCYFEDF